jgi:hypothetical protein
VKGGRNTSLRNVVMKIELFYRAELGVGQVAEVSRLMRIRSHSSQQPNKS